MTRPWIRFEVDYLSHAKLRRAGPDARVAWPHILAAVKRASGYASDDDLDPFVFADQVGLDESFWACAIADLKAHGLLVWGEGVVRLNKKAVRDVAGWQPPNWGGYQYDNRPSGQQRKAAASRTLPDPPREGGTTPGNASLPPGCPVPSSPVGLSETSSSTPKKAPKKRKASKSSKSIHPDAQALLDHFKAEFKRWSGKDTRRTLARFNEWVAPRLEEHGLEACKEVATFVFRSDNYLARNLRDGGHAVGQTPWRPSKFETYLDLAALPTASFPSNDSLPQAVGGMQYVPFANDRNVLRDPSGLWLLSELNLLDESLPWYSVVAEVMQGFLNRKAAGERVDRYRPESYLRALSDCSHPAKPEQPQYLNNVLGRVVSRLEEGWQG
ncbi:MAG: hypothetical protein ACYTFV_14740 [Planctomycetota bacterium]|jgi:hypothetical protein